MRKLPPLPFLLLFSIMTFAQKNKDSNIPAFGNVIKEELDMKECDFDKKAEAVVLFEKGELSCVIAGNGVSLELERHVRIKILKDEGRSASDIHLPYYNWGGVQSIDDLVAQTYNLDPSGKVVITKVDKKSIFEKKLNKRITEKVFTFPEVKAGSIIEYKYVLAGAALVDWYFQRNIPVKYSQFAIDFPSEIEIHASPKCSREYDKKISETSTRTTQFFAMKDVPALRDEPYILNEDDYMERVETKPVAFNINGRRESMVVYWPKVIKALIEDEDFGIQLKKEVPRTADLDAELKIITDPYLRMKTIYNYVKKNMEWNGYEGIWAFDGIKAAWKDKKGTAGEINLILVNLLKDAGLKTKPILVSTHDNGLVNTTDAGVYGDYGYNQFNKVLAWVEINDRVYVLDATSKETPPHLIPRDVILTEGLVIDKVETFDWGWKTLWDDQAGYKNLILINGEIDENNKLTGEVSINSYDYARLDRISEARKDKKNFTEKYFSSPNPGITVDSLVFENLDSDSMPLVQRVYFNHDLSASGEYKYFTTNLFTGLEKNPFVADTRYTDVFFGVNQVYNIVSNFSIPDGYVFEELPKNIKMIMPDTSISISRVSQANETRLAIRILLEFRKPFYSIGEYPEFKEFYKKLQDILNEQYVIRKKP